MLFEYHCLGWEILLDTTFHIIMDYTMTQIRYAADNIIIITSLMMPCLIIAVDMPCHYYDIDGVGRLRQPGVTDWQQVDVDIIMSDEVSGRAKVGGSGYYVEAAV